MSFEKTLAACYLPPEILNRPKLGFSVALPYVLRDEYKMLYRRFLTDSTLVRDGVLRAAPITALLGEHMAGRADHGNRLWLLINAELWYRMMIHGGTRESLRAELQDAQRGSGFSFADLAADQAGTRFGERVAAGSPQLERLFAGTLRDADLLPPRQGLPEYLPQAEFERRYGGPGQPAYQQVEAEIGKRLAQLAWYR